MRTLILFLLLLAGIYFARRLLARTGEGLRRRQSRPAASERMVACAHCGLHVPESEAVIVDGVGFCSAEHRRLHQYDRT